MTTAIPLLLAALLALPQPAEAPQVSQPAALRTTGEGFVFVDAAGPVVGDRGTLRTYRLEVEPRTDVPPRVFTAIAERILSDPRGWTGIGRAVGDPTGPWRLQRVRRRPDLHVVLASPATVDRLCAKAGLHTHGEVSCWNGRFAALNVKRWRRGAKGFAGPRRQYRRYLLHHEVGHGLGYGHRSCPRRGARAPVMQQQTYATRPCRANGWPTGDPR